MVASREKQLKELYNEIKLKLQHDDIEQIRSLYYLGCDTFDDERREVCERRTETGNCCRCKHGFLKVKKCLMVVVAPYEAFRCYLDCRQNKV